MMEDRRLKTLLFKAGRLSQEQYEKARGYQTQAGGTLADALERTEVFQTDELVGIVAEQSGRCVVNLANCHLGKEVLEVLPKTFCKKRTVIPFSVYEKTLTVAVEDPFDINLLDDIRKHTDRKINVVIARPGQIAKMVDLLYDREEDHLLNVAGQVEKEFSAGAVAAAARTAETEVMVDLDDNVTEESAPIIRLASQIVEDAFRRGASDIHIEPFPDEIAVRVRVDGELETLMKMSTAASRAIVNRIKIMAKLDIAERRLPQDGRIAFSAFSRKGTDLELRVSTLPVADGEKVVMRLIDKSGIQLGLDTLGFKSENLVEYRRLIRQPYGMILHVGPTGSGKTTTLYAALSEINLPGINIQTAEDPIEYRIKGLNQSQMRSDIGYTFARAIRSFLRQDPDVILVGEIRDLETANAAVQASLTGHLLFSTLHTNDAVSTITRFINMGIDPFLVGSSLLCICAQRLMRRLCKCAEERPIADSEAKIMATLPDRKSPAVLKHPKGCADCRGTGYSGRIGVHELLVVNDEIRELVTDRISESAVQQAALKAGMTPLHEDALLKVRAGVTSLEEALSVVRIG